MTPKAVVRAHATTGVPILGSMPSPQDGLSNEPVGDAGERRPPSPGPPSGPWLPGRPVTPPECDESVELGDGDAPIAGLGPGEPLDPGVDVAGTAVGVGFAVARGFGVGFGVGLGVGFGFGALITTRFGETALRMMLRAPVPEPLAALNR
jgi:hypothetical protein